MNFDERLFEEASRRVVGKAPQKVTEIEVP